ncbi:hypothetical protein N7478_009256 [Penicillium angulare]|uniref:uncharacterized protein n=1 Tax=Penicillium angulare TaxID=116970 RepID=UPI002540D963|nr:uncharacterized protein N7478_009256 [Penicillium angulare]KAJ5266448.1 hypothetical protein N7478_009256 [Penicillium angulare]
MKLSFLQAIFLGSISTLSVAKSIACTRKAVSDILPRGVSLSFVQHIPKNGTFTVPEGDTGWPIDPINLPELCAIGAMVPGTNTNKTFGFGLFLPLEWNGRTLSTIISDPYGCNFNAESLLCKSGTGGSNLTDCLSPEQLSTFDTLTRDYVGMNSTLIFPAWLLGSEHFWDLNIDGGAPNIIGLGYIQYMMGLGSDWKWRDFDESIVDLSEQLNPGQADASNYDLAPFFRSGNKFIHYHGLSDGGIATGASFYLYDQIDRAISTENFDISDSYRFFPIPGMGYAKAVDPFSSDGHSTDY